MPRNITTIPSTPPPSGFVKRPLLRAPGVVPRPASEESPAKPSPTMTAISIPSSMDFEGDVKIRPDALDAEWVGQSGLMMRYGRLASAATLRADQAKERLGVVRAGLDRRIRSAPAVWGLNDKPTEGAIGAAIDSDDKYRASFAEWLQAKYNADLMDRACRAMYARKDALENLVRLHGQQYFAGPRAPRDLPAEVERLRDVQHDAAMARIREAHDRKKGGAT